MRPFEDVVTDEGPVVWRVCRSLLGPADAEDAWSETFLAALRAYPGLPPGSNVRGWLTTIAYRKAIDVLRADARRPVPHAVPPEPPPALPPASATDHGELADALRRLPPKQQACVVLRHLADLPYDTIAGQLGISTAAARRNAADGLAALRRNPTLRPLPDLEPARP